MTPKPGTRTQVRSGRGALYSGRSVAVRRRELNRRENVGMSNEKYARIILTESPRVPGEG